MEYLIQSELNLAVKTKTFPSVSNYLIHYENLPIDLPLTQKKKRQFCMSFYSAVMIGTNRCQLFQTTRYNSLPKRVRDKKFVTYYYKELRDGNLSIVDPEF